MTSSLILEKFVIENIYLCDIFRKVLKFISYCSIKFSFIDITFLNITEKSIDPPGKRIVKEIVRSNINMYVREVTISSKSFPCHINVFGERALGEKVNVYLFIAP